MIAKKIIYQKLFSLGGYEHEKIGIELEIEEGEKASEVLALAKEFVERETNKKNDDVYDYERALKIVSEPDDFTMREINEAKKLLEAYEAKKGFELPF